MTRLNESQTTSDAPEREARVSVVLTDVDGTLLTKDKILTERALRAVAKLRERGILFTITSGRPPFGMRMLVEPLGLTLPMAAFNGGALVLPDLSVLDERLLPEYLLPALIDMVAAHNLDVWVFRTTDWCVRSPTAWRVDRETSNIRRPPVVVKSFEEVLTNVVKIVGVSQDPALVATCETAVQQAFGSQVFAARSTSNLLDITDPAANKGVVIERLSRYLNIPLDRIAALGDQPNDLPMLKRSGLSIAMGNANDDVKRQAAFVTTSFADEGFAHAVEEIILPRAEPAGGPNARPTALAHRLGQSIWLDGITRDMIQNGTLASCLQDFSVTGVTFNLATFEQAVQSSAYDRAIAELTRKRTTSKELFFDLTLDDVTRAADLLKSIHERSAAMDGWVSLDLAPRLAQDSTATVAAATTLFTRAGRPNVMIKIPATAAGLCAIEEAIFAGVPVNVTLLFSREHYLAAAEAYLRGIERRVEAGLRPDVVSVASIVVSTWDTAVSGQVPDQLRTQLGIAMAQRTYKTYRSLLHSPRWQRVYNEGARTQRLVWVSTEASQSGAPDLYAMALTAPFTAISMTKTTLQTFADRGKIITMLHADGGACEDTLAAFSASAIDLYALAAQLQEKYSKSFSESWDHVMALLASKAATSAAA